MMENYTSVKDSLPTYGRNDSKYPYNYCYIYSFKDKNGIFYMGQYFINKGFKNGKAEWVNDVTHWLLLNPGGTYVGDINEKNE